MTVVLASLLATKSVFYWLVSGDERRGPCSLRRGWGSAGGSGLTWHMGEEFAAWWQEAINVVVGGCVFA